MGAGRTGGKGAYGRSHKFVSYTSSILLLVLYLVLSVFSK
jgi:hypothetical protein